MTGQRRADVPRTRRDFLAAKGVLLIVREPPPAPPPVKGQPTLVASNPAEGPEVLLAVWDDGSVTALNGHVDLGTGLQTALAQIVAEELDVALTHVRMVLGHTASAPNQGATIASASIQVHAQPLRLAAAQAKAWLHAHGGPAALTDRCEVLQLDPKTAPKPPEDYGLVGTAQPRIDIPGKLAGELTFVHDMRVPGMLHGRVVRPPYAGADHGDFIGNTLESVDESSIAHIPGIRALVVIRDFVGIVAEREEHAEQAMRELRVTWKPWPGMPALNSADALEHALRTNPATQRVLIDEGAVDLALAGAAQAMSRTYVWPYQMHASIGPSCALAEWQPTDGEGIGLRVWAGTQNPHVLRADLARLLGLEDVAVDVVRMEAAGCYGRNGADDVAADAALLARAASAPVRVQLTREQENAWEPKGAAQLMHIKGGLDAVGGLAAYDFETSYPSNGAPTLALLLTRTLEPVAQAYEMGDRTARPPYAYANLRVKVNDMAPIVRASWLRGVSALPNSFAHESYIDELATAAGVDPVAFRLRHLKDPRAVELVQETAQKAGWRPRRGPQEHADGGLGPGGDILFGQGFAYARYIHSKWPGFGASWAAWVADVEVNRKTGEVHVRRVVVGHDAGLMVNPAGVEHQVHGNVIQTTSRALKEKVDFAPPPSRAVGSAQLPGVLPSGVVASREWGSYPILSFREVPTIEVVHMRRPGDPPLGAGESSSVPGTAAIANAIFDATGVRFRSPPFTPEVVRAALHPLPSPTEARGNRPAEPPMHACQLPAHAAPPTQRSVWRRTSTLLVAAIGAGAALLGWRPAIAPISLSSASIYSPATILRGQQLAAIGNCAGCHTVPGGVANAGGRVLQTPFGTVTTTNLTPDPETGLGHWSFSAFQRAMREGISRDGRHLYPAFPYTAFAKISDDDLQALYAYFMSLPPVRAQTPNAELRFPFSLRPLMAGWNALFNDPVAYRPVADRSPEWNRGAYLVNGLGHCGACHTPRNALGAERGGTAFLAGAVIDGWEAPALTALSSAPVPWDPQALYDYLRRGHSPQHGSASGPMAEVVRSLNVVSDEDIRAMATYLATFQPSSAENTSAQAQEIVARARARVVLPGPGQRLFDGACSACHHDGDGPRLLGVNVPLALNSNLHSERPDNLLRVILDGIREPAGREVGFMPGFRDNLSDAQVAELATYMRQRFAPGKPPWADLVRDVARLRADKQAIH